MANLNQIKRLEILISLVRKYMYISKSELLDRMKSDYDLEVTSRTLERDLQFLGTEMGVDVSYDRTERGYFIGEESAGPLANFLQFAGRIFLGELFRDALKDFDSLKVQVKPEDYSAYEGLAQMQPILLAIRANLEIEFVHESFERNAKTRYCITPFQLREYDRRWYVVGLPKGEEHIKTFGLSRISGIRHGDPSSIRWEDYKHQLNKFENIVGLNYDEYGAAVKTVINLSLKQYKYLKTLPLHKSQHLEKFLPDGRVQISFVVILNYEFKMQLLKMSDKVEVVEPEYFRNEMRECLERTLEFYR